MKNKEEERNIYDSIDEIESEERNVLIDFVDELVFDELYQSHFKP